MKKKYPSIYTITFLSGIFLILLIFAVKSTMDQNEGLWTYIARLWIRDAIVPYRGAYDSYPAGIIILFAGCFRLCGIHVLLPRILGILAVICSAYQINRIGEIIYTKRAGILAMTIFGLAMTWPSMNNQFRTEVDSFMVFFLTSSLYLLIKIAYHKNGASYFYGVFLSGLLNGIATAFKQTAVFSTIGIFIFFHTIQVSVSKQKSKQIHNVLFFTGGIIIGHLLCIIPLLLSYLGFSEYIDSIITPLLTPYHFGLYTHITMLLEVWRYSDLLLFYPLLLLFLILRKDLSIKLIPVTGLLWLLLFDFFGVASSGLYWNYSYKQILPVLSIIGGIIIQYLIATIPDAYNRMKRFYLIICIIILIGLPFRTFIIEILTNVITTKHTSIDLGEWIKKNTNATESIYLYSPLAPTTYVYADRQSPTRFIMMSNYRILKYATEAIGDIMVNLPTFIIVTDYNYIPNWLNMIIEQLYYPLQKCDSIQIYKIIP